MNVPLDGEHLTIEDVCHVAERGAAVSLSAAAIEKMQASREPVERLAEGDDPIYGVNTGVGLLADIRVPREDLDQLQLNVVRSHAAGVGPPLGRAVVRAMMLIRANVLAKGFSGIRPVVAEQLCELLNRGVTPIIPEQGSVGASGDLAPLAHMALVLVGEGEAEFQGATLAGGEALRRAGLEPLQFHPKEGLSLINGTQAMLAIGCLELAAAHTLANSGDVIAAMTLDALRGTPVAFDPRIHAARPHPGQGQCAARLRRLLEGGALGDVRRVTGTFTYAMRPLDPTNIRLHAELGGGSLLDVGCYPVYGIRWAFGAEPVRVYATARSQYGVDVEMSGTRWFADGRVGTFDCGFTLPSRQWLEISGTEGVLSIPEMWSPPGRARYLVQASGRPVEEVAVEGEDQIVHMIEDFSRAALDGTPVSPAAEEAVRTLRVLDALAASARQNRVIDV